MRNIQGLQIFVAFSLVLSCGSACMASKNDESNKQNKSQPESLKKCNDGSERSKSSSKVKPAKSNYTPVKPMPSMMTETPAFQSSLTKLIRTKGHADHARKKGDLEKAKKLYLSCIRDPSVNHRSLGYCYKSLGDIYFKEKNNAEAEKYYKLAIVQMRKHKVKGTADGLQEKLDKMIEKQKEDGKSEK